MLQDLIVKNYRNLRDLRIEKLGRVNLITGKNNTGKTALLEAISIYGYHISFKWLIELLICRGEYSLLREEDWKNNLWSERNLKSLSGLFTNRDIGIESQKIIEIGSTKELKEDNLVTLKIVNNLQDEIQKHLIKNQVGSSKAKSLASNINGLSDSASSYGFIIKKGVHIEGRGLENYFKFSPTVQEKELQLIRTNEIGRNSNSVLWDKLVLKSMDDSVFQTLKIIEPKIERINFVGDEYFPENRNAVIKMENSRELIPLQSMGDGINRILTIILALVNAKDSYLLIDEFENGLHYSVQEKLWEVIFQISKELNVQVFATTHSSDCIAAFSVVQRKHEESAGQYIRLQNKNGNIVSVLYDTRELQIATESNIESR